MFLTTWRDGTDFRFYVKKLHLNMDVKFAQKIEDRHCDGSNFAFLQMRPFSRGHH